jgi:hypothetical protein
VPFLPGLSVLFLQCITLQCTVILQNSSIAIGLTDLLINVVTEFHLRMNDTNFIVFDIPNTVEIVSPKSQILLDCCNVREYGLGVNHSQQIGGIVIQEAIEAVDNVK